MEKISLELTSETLEYLAAVCEYQIENGTRNVHPRMKVDIGNRFDNTIDGKPVHGVSARYDKNDGKVIGLVFRKRVAIDGPLSKYIKITKGSDVSTALSSGQAFVAHVEEPDKDPDEPAELASEGIDGTRD